MLPNDGESMSSNFAIFIVILSFSGSSYPFYTPLTIAPTLFREGWVYIRRGLRRRGDDHDPTAFVQRRTDHTFLHGQVEHLAVVLRLFDMAELHHPALQFLLRQLGTAGHEHRREEGLSALLLTGDGREVAARETGFAIKTHQEVLFGHVGIGHNPATVEFPERRCYLGGLTSPGEFLSYGVLFSVHFSFI